MKQLLIAASILVLMGCKKDNPQPTQVDSCEEKRANCIGNTAFLQISSHEFDTFHVEVYLVGPTEYLRQGSTRVVTKGSCMEYPVKVGRDYVMDIAGVKNTRKHTRINYPINNVQGCFVSKFEY
jgi:hypothetical protein